MAALLSSKSRSLDKYFLGRAGQNCRSAVVDDLLARGSLSTQKSDFSGVSFSLCQYQSCLALFLVFSGAPASSNNLLQSEGGFLGIGDYQGSTALQHMFVSLRDV